MNIIKFCEKHLSNSELRYAKDTFRNVHDSMSSLRLLCGRKGDLKIAVIRYIVMVERIKAGNIKERNRQIQKIRKKRRDKFLKSYADTINQAIILNPLKRSHIKKKFFDFLSDIKPILSEIPADEPLKMAITYNFIMRDLFEMLQKSTSHTDNAIYKYLSDLLNNLGCTSPQNTRFTRQLLRSLISS